MAIRYRTLHGLILLLAFVTLLAAWRTGEAPRLPAPAVRKPALPAGLPAGREPAAAALSAPRAAAPAGAPASTPEDAVAGYVTGRLGRPFAGDCLDARPPTDLGRQCSVLAEQRGDHRAYAVGPVSGEPQLWLFLRQEAAGWSVYAAAPFDPASAVRRVPWPPPEPPVGPPLRPGLTVEVHGSGGCLAVRREPGGPAAACLPDGHTAVLDGGPAYVGFHQWWRLAGLGWAPGAYLRPR